MKTIVAASDFSSISLNAVNYAADMACVISTDLTLFHTCLIPMSYSEVPAPAYSLTEMTNEAEEKIKQLKEKILTRTGGRLKINTIVKQGDVVAELDDYCSEINPYAVVMGAESAGAFERFLFGAKTISAVKRLSWPLIIVPPEVRFTSIRKIGLACDFKDVVENIPLKELRDMVNTYKAELHVLHVSNEKGNNYSDEKMTESQWLWDILKELKPEYHFIRGNDVEKNIHEFAEKNKLDLLVIIPKKHPVISKLFKPRHSKRLVLHTHVPVMAMHE